MQEDTTIRKGVLIMSDDRVKRTYDVPFDLHKWLEDKAAREGRSVVRQVEKIFEQARAEDEAMQKGQ